MGVWSAQPQLPTRPPAALRSLAQEGRKVGAPLLLHPLWQVGGARHCVGQHPARRRSSRRRGLASWWKEHSTGRQQAGPAGNRCADPPAPSPAWCAVEALFDQGAQQASGVEQEAGAACGGVEHDRVWGGQASA